ncbi:LANO_0E11386g1_1 [Lachancea nothofagi CBS 11611]|uniref:LANO_0E11386g1_1 n=1 Tax=Lachancea nothofagi CBS 11611 TaxID=1266666 RepID=A0A1G4JXE6_9SACH|nr:LANO_0E11386g1_1 [Lachancea nothofagi CBS 11611]
MREDLSFSIFELVVSLCPADCFSPMLGDRCDSRIALETELEREIISHPELDLEVEPRFLLKSISRTQLYDQSALEFKIKLIVLSKTLIALFDYFDEDFSEAFFKFRWILQFLHEARKVPGIFNLEIILSLDYERSLSLLCARSLIKDFRNFDASRVKSGAGFKVNRLDIFEGLLANILDCTEPSILTCVDELDYYMMDQLFTVLGEMEKCIAFLKGPLCDVDGITKSEIYAVRPQRSHIDGMIRKYILASTFKLPGDPTFSCCFDKVLEGVILYGGIHLCVIAFFHKLKTFHEVECRKVCSSQPSEVVESSYVALTTEIIRDWDYLNTGSQDLKFIQCPQVLMKANSNEIIMVDSVYEESEKDHNHDITLLLSAAKIRAKRKFYGDSQLHQQFSESQWHMGLSWVQFWKNCYLDNKGDMAPELSDLVEKMYDYSSSPV